MEIIQTAINSCFFVIARKAITSLQEASSGSR